MIKKIIGIIGIGILILGLAACGDSDEREKTPAEVDKTDKTEADVEAERLAAEQAEQEKQALAEQQKQAQMEQLLDQADRLAQGYYYEQAIKLLQSTDIQDSKLSDKIDQIEEARQQLIRYEGDYYHVFFHSLIIEPDKAFAKTSSTPVGYNMWMTTVDEFKKMLDSMYAKGFVLYRISELVEFDAQGKAQPKPIYLPAGKKPLVISIDDVCYYDYMQGDGFAWKLALNTKGEVVTMVGEEGALTESYDGDVMPIVDKFVEAHPDFSYQGAKGVIAVTGYQGALGYRVTDLEDYSEAEGKQMLADLTEVAAALRHTGWEFACHSYTHNGDFGDGKFSMERLVKDTERWEQTIEPYIGETHIYITPFGYHLKEDDPRYDYIVSKGFDIFCPVGQNMHTEFRATSMVQSRLNLDGYTMFKRPHNCEPFFEVAAVIDSKRPPLE